MNLQRYSVTVTTDASGDAVGYTEVAQGLLHSIHYDKPLSGGLETATVTVTTDESGQTLWSESNVDASADLAPRQATCDYQHNASLYAAGGEPVEDKFGIARERIKVVIASGGDTKSGTFHFLVG